MTIACAQGAARDEATLRREAQRSVRSTPDHRVELGGGWSAPIRLCARYIDGWKNLRYVPDGQYEIEVNRLAARMPDLAAREKAHQEARAWPIATDDALTAQPSLSGHCGHGPVFTAQRSVANDPDLRFIRRSEHLRRRMPRRLDDDRGSILVRTSQCRF